jgi:exodeoxyribonuclease-5
MLKRPAAEDFERLVHDALPFTAGNDQSAAIKKISRFILSDDQQSLFILKGYAGTGKTSLISAVTRVLPSVKWRSVLLAPTGRAAKVISAYSKREAFTIHKKIFRKIASEDGGVIFALAENLHKNTLFIVDEASMISADQDEGGFFSSLLSSLFEYVYSGQNCKLIMVGDTAQLPPVGSDNSPALDPEYLKRNFHLSIYLSELKEVARQQQESGILLNATWLRILLQQENISVPRLECGPDVVNLTGDELQDTLQSSISQHGDDNVIIITRSNKRANLFNQNFRNRIRLFEEDLCAGDKLMVVKNNYFWLPEKSGDNFFIANGDMVEIQKIIRRESMYGFEFADVRVRFCDNDQAPVQEVKIITSSLYTDSPSLSREEQQLLYQNILEDVADEPSRTIKMNYLRKSPHYNALQVKFSYAVTCHKSQGGQWPVIFLDQGFIKEENIDRSFVRWLYTAITRASEKVYLINFNELFIK